MKISIITVCFNSAQTICETLRSVRDLENSDFEHIVIDGASTDGTLDVIKDVGQHVSKIVSEPDNGIYDAMNKGIALATGDVIGFLNADDFYASVQALAMVSEVFQCPAVDACYGDLCYVHPVETTSVVRYWRSTPFQLGSFSRAWCPPHPTFFVRRSVYEKLGGFDLRYKMANDVELMMRFMEVHKICVKYIPELLVKMRLGGASNKSLKNVVIQNGEILRALKQHDLPANAVSFFTHKILSRGRQFFVRPKAGATA